MLPFQVQRSVSSSVMQDQRDESLMETVLATLILSMLYEKTDVRKYTVTRRMHSGVGLLDGTRTDGHLCMGGCEARATSLGRRALLIFIFGPLRTVCCGPLSVVQEVIHPPPYSPMDFPVLDLKVNLTPPSLPKETVVGNTPQEVF